MNHTLNISAEELCRILSAPLDALTPLEQALRKAIENAYGPAQTEAMREQACLDASLPEGKDKSTDIDIDIKINARSL